MAQFQAITNHVKVNRQTVASVVEAQSSGKEFRMNALKTVGIDLENDPSEWLEHQSWLDAFRIINEEQGGMNVFMIGKAVVDHAEFPPMNNLEEALRSIDIAYHMNHQLNGKKMFDGSNGSMLEGIGHYNLAEFDAAAKRAVMVCDNPYPSRFDEGIITQVVRRFKPIGSRESVSLDQSKESRLKGGNSCTYVITW